MEEATRPGLFSTEQPPAHPVPLGTSLIKGAVTAAATVCKGPSLLLICMTSCSHSPSTGFHRCTPRASYFYREETELSLRLQCFQGHGGLSGGATGLTQKDTDKIFKGLRFPKSY